MKDFLKKIASKINLSSKKTKIIFAVAVFLVVLFLIGQYFYSKYHISDYSRVTVLVNEHKYTEAEILLQSFLEENSQDPYFLILAARTYIGLGEISHNTEIRQEMLLKAIKFINSAESIDNTISEIYRTKGLAYLNLGEIKSAETFYKKALSLSLDSVDLRIDLGGIALSNHNINRAYEYYNAALDLDPNSGQAKIGIVKIMQLQKRYETALSYARKAHSESSLNTDKSQLALLIGQLYFKLNNYVDSKKFYNEALSINPESVYAYYGLAETEFAKSFNVSRVASSTVEARTLAEKAIQKDPVYPYTYILLSRITSLTRDKEAYDKYSALAREKIMTYSFLDSEAKSDLLKSIPAFEIGTKSNIKIKVISAKVNTK